MKTFLKIVGGVAVVLIVLLIGLNLYFTDDRLKSTVMPYVNDAVGRTVDVESMSLTFFSTFPQPGLSIKNMRIPGDTESDTLLSLDELVASVELFSLMGDQINISEISVRNPKFTYVIYPDSTTNIDFLMTTEETEEDTSAGYAIDIPYFQVTGGNFGYRDEISNTNAQLSDLNADISLNYADQITSTFDIELGGLTATVDGANYVNGLPLSISQESTIDMENETVTLEQGTFSIRGLALNLSGSISDWSQTTTVDLTFNSSSDNFGELLRLVPAKYEEQIQNLETRGALAIDGTLNGPVGGEELPNFNLSMQITDGYLKNPDLPQPIQNIQLSAKASNKLVTIENLTAQAGENNLSGNGELANPMEENGIFTLNFNADVNLGTVREFYDISQFDIDDMSGQLTVDAQAKGNRNAPEEANFSGVAKLTNGSLKFAQVPKSIENISVDAKGDQSSITISNMQLQAASNTFAMSGVINQPLNEQQRSINLNTDLKFDLATIKEFYPISEDTLTMRGMLTANATLSGKADQIERAVKKGTISLANGYIDYKPIAKPIQDITLQSTLNGPTLTISKASFKTGDNNLSASGTITDYLSESRSIDLKINGNAALNQITEYYDLNPTITKLTGKADLNLRATGPVADPAVMTFDGQMNMQDVNMEGEALVQPVTNMNGQLTLSGNSATLKSLYFKLGSSDFSLSGSLQDYMAYLKAEEDRTTTPHLKGTYKSEFLNLDELIDWSDTTSAPIPIHLPDLTSSVKANISKMIVTGVSMTNLDAQASTTPKQISLEKATIELFEGKATGAFTWDVPQPDHTMISFKGSLDSLQAESFFAAYPILGEKSNFHEHVSGAFSANVDYYSELNEYLDPLINTSKMDGDFGMTKSRLKGHPVQVKIANLIRAQELSNMALDEWKSTYTLDNSIFTIKDLRLTSGDIGMELNGTQHLVKQNIDYQVQLFLPGRFKSAIASVITKQATEALTQKNGTIMLPLRVTGTNEDPQVRPDKEVIAPIVKEYLKTKATDVLDKIFGNG